MKSHFRVSVLHWEYCSVKLIRILKTNLISSPWRSKYCDFVFHELTVSLVGVVRQNIDFEFSTKIWLRIWDKPP